MNVKEQVEQLYEKFENLLKNKISEKTLKKPKAIQCYDVGVDIKFKNKDYYINHNYPYNKNPNKLIIHVSCSCYRLRYIIFKNVDTEEEYLDLIIELQKTMDRLLN